MTIFLNGESHAVTAHLILSQLLEQLELADKRVAVEINGEIVPRSQHEHTKLQTDDRIEIIHAVGGG